MEQELKQRWVEALRSGRYVQGHGQLYYDGAYCCLGVLADLLGLLEVRHDEHAEYGAWLSVPVRKMIGMSDTAHAVLINMNDGIGANFNEIADWIEEKL